ncbi:hypothetical protein [Phaeodactylibacter xiamenensis]|uniref:hypothetical protein n=1 Tax=Phaeodactylibacter xiamenensis TaxID=1524460 RepID=UPI0024A7CF4A|nr:hypothetical protein [Phaeodactylibacter xiamenensis]
MAGNNDISWDEIKALFAETNRKFQETDRLLTEKFQETDRQFKETDRKFQDTDRKFQDTDRKLDKRFNELYGLFSSQWGRLVESLVEGELVRTFEKRGSKIEQTAQRLKGSHKGQRFEFDIIARNGTEVVVVEVKTMLKSKHIQKFVDKMGSFKTWVKRYTPNNVYGAVAFLQADAGAEQMAENKGLFVIRATGDSAAIVNKADFVPRTF